LEIYAIANNQITNAAFIGTVGFDWQFSGVGNFSGVPGETDLLLRNVNTGGLEVSLCICKSSREGGGLTGRYVANGPHCWAMWIRLTESRGAAELTKRLDVKRPDIRARGTSLKYRSRIFWIDGRRTRAAAKAP
jgi:hypothetical protein